MTRINLIPAIFLLLGTLLTLMLGRAVNQSNLEELSLETRITAEQVQLRLESCISSRISVVNQLASPKWVDKAELRRNWTTEAEALVNLFPGIQALNFVNSAGVIELIHPYASNEPALGANLHNHPDPIVGDALGNADQSSQLTRTNIIQLLQGGGGFAMYKKIYSNTGVPLGFANGVFRINDLIETCLSERELRSQFEFRLTELDGSPVYRSSSRQEIYTGSVHASSPVDVAGRPWQLELAPTQAFLLNSTRGIEDTWVYVGLVLVLLLTAAIRTLLLKQQSLRDSQEKYRLLIENQSDMVVKVDANFEFVYVSPSYCATFGKTEAELLGHSYEPLVHEEDIAHTRASLATLSPDNRHCYHEQRALTKDGWRWLAWSNTGIFDGDNTLTAITAVGRDITDIKKLKEDIAHNQKMQAIGEMASGITHDFNNLLQVMMANIEFLLRGNAGNEKSRGQLQKIQKALERARSLIGKLSTLSKQELLIKHVVELNQYTTDVIEMFRESLPETVSITFQHAIEQLRVEVDAAQFERVLLNLLINAREAMDEKGEIQVTIGRRHLDAEFCRAHKPTAEPGDYAWIAVTDSGHGIPAGALSRIFDPFYSTKSRGKSSGLGLANSYSIIKQMDGVIDVASIEGQGATFTVYLPLAERTGESASIDLTDLPKPTGDLKNLVIVADDEPELLEITTQILQDAGYETLPATNGKKALQLFEDNQESVALVILDLVMPIMSGQQAAIEIRKRAPAVKILFISGYIPEAEGRTIHLDGPLLRKPFRSSALVDQINTILH